MKNSLRYKIGIAEIVSIVVGIVGYLLLEIVLNMNNIAIGVIGDCIRSILVSLLAGFFGPIVGMFVGFIGAQIQCNLSGQNFAVIISLSMALYGFVIGLYAKRFHVREGRFNKEAVQVLESIQAIAAIFCFVILKPFLIFISSDSNLFGLIEYGCKCALVTLVAVGILNLLVYEAITYVIKWLGKRKESTK